MKKILLMALVMVTLIAVGCGSGKNEQATKQQALTSEEQLEVYKKWDTELIGEVDKVVSAYDSLYKTPIKKIAGNPPLFEEPITSIKLLDKTLIESSNIFEKMKAPSQLDKEKQAILNNVVSELHKWVEKRRETCKLTLDMLNKMKDITDPNQQLTIMKEYMPKIESNSNEGEVKFINAMSEIKKMRDLMRANAGKSNSDVLFAKEELPKNQSSNKQDNTNPSIQNVQNAFSKVGINGTVVATSYGHSNKGFLTKLDGGGIILIDSINTQTIGVIPPDVVDKIAGYKGSGKKKIELNLVIFGDTHDSDAASGAWKENNHILPILVEYNYENGQHVPYMIKTGAGLPPASYDNYLYEQKNVDAVNMIIEEAAAMK